MVFDYTSHNKWTLETNESLHFVQPCVHSLTKIKELCEPSLECGIMLYLKGGVTGENLILFVNLNTVYAKAKSVKSSKLQPKVHEKL